MRAMTGGRAISRSSDRAAWRHAITRAALLLFALRAFIPVGFMPDPAALQAGRLEIVICTPSGLQTVAVDAAAKPVDPEGGGTQDKSAATECPFQAPMAKAVVVPEPMLVPMPRPQAPEALLAASDQLPAPPARGPPLGSRAPPARLV